MCRRRWCWSYERGLRLWVGGWRQLGQHSQGWGQCLVRQIWRHSILCFQQYMGILLHRPFFCASIFKQRPPIHYQIMELQRHKSDQSIFLSHLQQQMLYLYACSGGIWKPGWSMASQLPLFCIYLIFVHSWHTMQPHEVWNSLLHLQDEAYSGMWEDFQLATYEGFEREDLGLYPLFSMSEIALSSSASSLFMKLPSWQTLVLLQPQYQDLQVFVFSELLGLELGLGLSMQEIQEQLSLGATQGIEDCCLIQEGWDIPQFFSSNFIFRAPSFAKISLYLALSSSRLYLNCRISCCITPPTPSIKLVSLSCNSFLISSSVNFKQSL